MNTLHQKVSRLRVVVPLPKQFCSKLRIGHFISTYFYVFLVEQPDKIHFLATTNREKVALEAVMKVTHLLQAHAKHAPLTSKHQSKGFLFDSICRIYVVCVVVHVNEKIIMDNNSPTFSLSFSCFPLSDSPCVRAWHTSVISFTHWHLQLSLPPHVGFRLSTLGLVLEVPNKYYNLYYLPASAFTSDKALPGTHNN